MSKDKKQYNIFEIFDLPEETELIGTNKKVLGLNLKCKVSNELLCVYVGMENVESNAVHNTWIPCKLTKNWINTKFEVKEDI